mgnify:CR=1 FL=1
MNNDPAARIETAIRQHLAPLLRADGFVGSGRTFRRVAGDWIHVVNVQGSRYGGQFAVNLGVQPLAIPDVRGNPPDAKKITEELCEFRRRLSESEARTDKWWKHENTVESMATAMLDAATMYANTGRLLLGNATAPNSGMNTITACEFATGTFNFQGFGSTTCRMALALSRLRQAQGRGADSIEFAKYALEHIGSATFLKAQIQALLKNDARIDA